METASSSASTSGIQSTNGKLTNGISDKKIKLPNKTSNSKLKMTNGKQGDKAESIQKDTTTTDVYKSLFTTSKKAKNQQSAHWVTFNPFYN